MPSRRVLLTRKSLLALSVGVISLPICTSLYAQEGVEKAQQEKSIENITVTARGRVETIVEVPLSERYFSEMEIESARIKGVDDFIGLTPGVTLANAQDSGTNFITIRGVSQVRNGEPPVAVVVDDVIQVNSRSFDQGLFDLQSIEVLRGPQGALYGRNATQGAIIINTRKPSDVLEGYVQGAIGRGNEYQIEGSVSGPISDDLAFRLSARYYDTDGIYDNITTDEKINFKQETNLRGHLSFNPTDDLSIDIRGSLSDTSSDANTYTYQGVTISPDTGEVIGYQDASAFDSNIVRRNTAANNKGFDERQTSQLSVRVNYVLDWATLKSVTAYDTLEQRNGADQFPYSANTSVNPGISFSDGTQSQFVDVEAISQDLRFMSNDDVIFRWMFGVYYLATDRYISSSTGYDLGMGIEEVTRAPILGGAVNPTSSFSADDNNNTAYAGYFNFAYDVFDDLELSVAGRYDKDERKQYVDEQQGAYSLDGEYTGPIGTPGAVNKAEFSSFQPKVSLRYLFDSKTSLYTSWGRGFRSGQFNQNGVGAQAAVLGLNVSDVLDQENTETFEVGFKTTLLNGRLHTSGAVYSTEVENAPFFVFVGELGAQVLVGIDEISIEGGEFEASYDISDDFKIYAGLAISDSTVDAYSLEPSYEGNKAPYVPDSTFNAGLQYRTAISDRLDFFSRVDYQRLGGQYWDPANITKRDPVELTNLRVGVESGDGVWNVVGSINNLFDEEYNAEYVTGGFAYAAAPRIWRIDVRYNFY
ncbi:TonB-dependent receptor [Alteromonas sp. C1M14]|uniref:TonB-dependent receptor n=1 Tax=Alteromonas sp. C1M14 TaxID=2841567 RepID=UPI001C082602|nr:TonB-dependent receptor [Alteromonas sp. C1M14]MBU2979532.1 TonB-dependent receptor [Alteromonas sp. C1M14]